MTKPTTKILIVDDDDSVREAVRLSLQAQEYLTIESSEAIDVESAMKQMEAINPDIVILDLYLPDKSGLEFMDMIHRKKRFAKTEIIMLTAYDTLGNIFEAEKKGIGAYHFIGKPFNVAELQALVLSIALPKKI